MPFEILSCDADEARWRDLVVGLDRNLRDLHFLPEYARIYQRTYGYVSVLAVHSDANGYVLQPFIKRSLDGLPFMNGGHGRRSYWDIANPYGFGGPLYKSFGPSDGKRAYRVFADALQRWCTTERVASEFASLHPFLADQQTALISDVLTPHFQKHVVYMNLDQNEEILARNLRKGHRSSIAAARRANVVVEKVKPNHRNISLFNAMYVETMKRRGAADRWHFPPDYFANCIAELGEARCSLFFAKIGEDVESSCLLLHDFETGYYHFAATRDQHRALGVNNLLVWECALWLKASGFRRFHLGGGVTSEQDDNLLRFKGGFSPDRAPLFTYSAVRDADSYDLLCDRRRQFEQAMCGCEFTSDYFPFYRG
jgi:hypothetical protein